MTGEQVLAGRIVLVVDDEPFVALDVTEVLQEAGAEVVTGPGLAQGLRLAELPGLSAAVLDFRLGIGIDSMPIWRRLAERGVPFMFYSGYVVIEGDGSWAKAPILQKPATRRRIVDAVQSLIGDCRE